MTHLTAVWDWARVAPDYLMLGFRDRYVVCKPLMAYPSRSSSLGMVSALVSAWEDPEEAKIEAEGLNRER